MLKVLMEEGRAANPDLILVILPESAEDLRNAVKRFGDIECGVKTQCVVSFILTLIPRNILLNFLGVEMDRQT